MSARGGLARVAGYLRGIGLNYLFGEEFKKAREVLWQNQWYPTEIVRDLQWAQVQAVAESAYRTSPFYRSRLDDAGWPLFTPETFRRLLPLAREDIVSQARGIARPHGRGQFRRTSGGSSGQGVAIPIDREAYAWYLAGTWRGLRWWGADLSEPAVILLGNSTGSHLRALAVRAKDLVVNWLRIAVNERLDQRPKEILDRIAAFRPSFVYGYPSAVYRLVQAVRDSRWPLDSGLKIVVLTGEPVYTFQRRQIEAAFECPVAEEYGSGELGSMAFQCPEGSLHIIAESVYLETAPTQPQIASEGGLVLATQLRNRLFPLLRYQTGDFGAMYHEPCPCGRGLPTLRALGRARDLLTGSQGEALAQPRVDQFISMLPEGLQGHVQVVHPGPGRIVLHVERGCASQPRPADIVAIGADVFGPDWHISTVEVERLVRLPSGKLPYFVRVWAQA